MNKAGVGALSCLGGGSRGSGSSGQRRLSPIASWGGASGLPVMLPPFLRSTEPDNTCQHFPVLDPLLFKVPGAVLDVETD